MNTEIVLSTKAMARRKRKLLAALNTKMSDEIQVSEYAPSVLFLRDVPRDVHAYFKAYCALHGRTMRGVLLAFMQDVISKDVENKSVNFVRLVTRHKLPR